MATVLGVGGVFIKAPDQEAWRAWYRDVLGVTFEDFGGAIFKHPDVGSHSPSRPLRRRAIISILRPVR